MAIYQFFMAAIPQKGARQHFGKIPDKLEIDFQKRTEDILGEEDEFDYFEFVQHQCWKLAKINSKAIINQIDQKLNRANWGNDKESNNWKTQTNGVDHDAWILINPEKNQIKEFTFRADLRQSKLQFLIEMVELAKDNALLLIDRKGNVVEPKIKEVIKLIKQSNALRFLEDPIQFFTDLESGKIEME